MPGQSQRDADRAANIIVGSIVAGVVYGIAVIDRAISGDWSGVLTTATIGAAIIAALAMTLVVAFAISNALREANINWRATSRNSAADEVPMDPPRRRPIRGRYSVWRTTDGRIMVASEAFRPDEPTELAVPDDAEYIGSVLDVSIESATGQAARMLGLTKKGSEVDDLM